MLGTFHVYVSARFQNNYRRTIKLNYDAKVDNVVAYIEDHRLLLGGIEYQ